MFSKACEYAFRAVTAIAQASADKQRLSLDAIAEQTATPKAFMAKVLQQLSRAGIVDSTKGPNGGFDMPPKLAKKVKLSRIVSTIDDDNVFTGCCMGLPQCSDAKPCPMHDQFQRIKENLRTMLVNTSVYDLAEGLVEGKMFLK